MIEFSQLFKTLMSSWPHCSGYLHHVLVGCFLVWLAWIWRRRKVELRCWFCLHANFVSRSSQHWWKCNTCEQFNGFNSDGDHARDIPEMHTENERKDTRFCDYQKNIKTTNILCQPCTENQNRIIHALKDFKPSSDECYFQELQDFKIQLNMRYNLCLPCRTGVAFHLHSQDQDIQQSYNSNATPSPSKSEKGVRRLASNLIMPNIYFLGLYKVAHLASCLVSVWLSKQTNSSWKGDFVLTCVCLFFTTATLFLFLRYKKLDVTGSIVGALWILTVAFGNYKTEDSRYVRKILLTCLSYVGGSYLFVELLHLIIKLCKFVAYKNERKDKVQMMRPGQKREVDNVVLDQASEEITEEKPLKTVQSISKIDIRPTPDILEGHLDAMYIQRKVAGEKLTGHEIKTTNHVVSALKYKMPASNSIRVPGQILKPATFSGNVLRPAVFSATSSNVTWDDGRFAMNMSFNPLPNNCQFSPGKRPFEKQNLEKCHIKETAEAEETAPIIEHDHQSEIAPIIERNHQTKICTQSNAFILFFVCSVLSNLLFAYKFLQEK